RVLRRRRVRVVVDLGTGDDGHPLVEQRGDRTDHAALRLTSLTEEDHVVAGEQGVLELREHGVLVAEHAWEERVAPADLRDGVLANLVFDRARHPARRAQLAEGGRTIGHQLASTENAGMWRPRYRRPRRRALRPDPAEARAGQDASDASTASSSSPRRQNSSGASAGANR